MPGKAEAPVIVLVRPQLGENIGKAARAMLNFGLVEMRLVAPRDGWPNPSAGPAAAGADVVLERARVFETLAEAVADCAHVYATTVRKRGVTKPVVTPEQAASSIHRDPGRSAIVFGPERSGLETEEVALARAILTVPINPDFASLNLAQAVLLNGYEWFKTTGGEPPFRENNPSPPAKREMILSMFDYLEAELDLCGFFPPGKKPIMTADLRDILHRLDMTEQEAREAITTYQQESRRKMAEKNKKEGEEFLAKNKTKEGVKIHEVTLPDGTKAELQYKVITEGTGATLGSNDMVSVNYRGTLINGKEFDSSAKHGGQPAKFQANRVIRGWTEALQKMKVGSKWELYIPSTLAYGDFGSGPMIEPGSTLIFEVELLGIEAPQPDA